MCTTITVIQATGLDTDLGIPAMDRDTAQLMGLDIPATDLDMVQVMDLATPAMDLDMVQVMALAILVITGGRYKHLTPARIYKRRY